MKNMLQLTLIASALITAAAVAQDEGHLNVRTVVQKEEITVNDAGETERRLVPADLVVPGEDVIYTITFTNISDESAENIVITNPISEDLTYVEGSAFGPGTVIEFSVDGGETYGTADALIVKANGEERPAEAGDVTHVRWVMQGDLAAGARGMARFRARLN